MSDCFLPCERNTIGIIIQWGGCIAVLKCASSSSSSALVCILFDLKNILFELDDTACQAQAKRADLENVMRMLFSDYLPSHYAIRRDGDGKPLEEYILRDATLLENTPHFFDHQGEFIRQ